MRRVLVGLLFLALVAAACSPRSLEPRFEVQMEVVSHETTREIAVWAPAGEGTWPVVYALHGLGGDWESWSDTAAILAGQGVVVFAANYRSVGDAFTGGNSLEAERDRECGYRFVREMAGDYGGDLSLPVTMVGHSMGASGVLAIGLDDSKYGPDGTYAECFGGAPRPEVIVAVAGCHYEAFGFQLEFDPSDWENEEAKLVFIGGENDPICPAEQSGRAADELAAIGYDTEYVEVEGANHTTLLFRAVVDGEVVSVPDHPAGQEVARRILDAIDDAS